MDSRNNFRIIVEKWEFESGTKTPKTATTWSEERSVEISYYRLENVKNMNQEG